MIDDATGEALARLALDIASEAGLLIAHRNASDAAVAATKTSATDVVTAMDQRSQSLIAQLLRAARPGDGFLGEEGADVAGTTGITWVVDPIDGTVNYVYDIPAYAVSVAAVIGDPRQPGGWEPVAGAVVNPVSGERFWARRGGGAWRQRGRLEAERLQVSRQSVLGQSLIGTGFSYSPHTRAWQARMLTPVLPAIRDIRRFGSAALDLCHVADGTLDGYYERGLNPWDLAAGWLVVTEAGGWVGGITKDFADHSMTVAGGAVAAELRALLSSVLATVGDEDAEV